MFDKLIRYGAMTDWITPVSTWLMCRRNGPSVRYNICVQEGWSALAVQQILRAGGVKLWGLTIYGDIITFRTRTSQARYAQYLMQRAGIPYAGGVEETSTAGRPQRRPHQKSSRKHATPRNSLLTQLDRVLRWR